MADHANAELFRRGYTAFQTGDLDTVASLFDANIVWHIAGQNHFSGDHTGLEDVLALFGRNYAETHDPFKTEGNDMLANDTHAVAFATITASQTGTHLHYHYTPVVHIVGGSGPAYYSCPSAPASDRVNR